jgi:hypothetical protein
MVIAMTLMMTHGHDGSDECNVLVGSW